MYENPITRYTEDIMANIVKKEEGYLVESVHKVGFDIDKEELAKALRYDRDQYEKGFNDGRLSAESHWIPVTERLPEPVAESQKREWFITSNQYGGVTITCYEFESSPFKEGWQTDMTILAWMPLPAPWEGGAEDA